MKRIFAHLLIALGTLAVTGSALAQTFPSKPLRLIIPFPAGGTADIVARLIGDALGGGRDAMETFLRRRIFEPTGMTSATARFDDAGTFVGSSYVYATARDFARFGRSGGGSSIVNGGVGLNGGYVKSFFGSCWLGSLKTF